ncbi:amidohydrolase family protein [Nocardioides sp.]|uniref:amidohydrolase family protein n=1 Tax=Nocardioides sp. TaxID=35761 RepID=UPI002ED4C334
MPIVDVHAHGVPEDLVDTLEAAGGRLGATVTREGERVLTAVGDRPPGRVKPELLDLSVRLSAMDAAGVDVQLLSPWMDLTASAVAAAVAGDFARQSNDAMAAWILPHADRFLALATLPLRSPAEAAGELRRAVVDLGMVGAEIATRPGGRELDDESFGVLWDAARELDCMVLVHPFESLQGRGVTRHFLGNLVGNPAETTIAVGHLVFGGVVDRHPGVRFCFVHGGGFAPYQVGRWNHAFRQDARGAAERVRTLPGDLLRRLWFDSVVHDEGALRHLLATVGDDQVVLGSDYPFEMGDPDPVGSLRNVMGTRERLHQVTTKNAGRLLGSHAVRLGSSGSA